MRGKQKRKHTHYVLEIVTAMEKTKAEKVNAESQRKGLAFK